MRMPSLTAMISVAFQISGEADGQSAPTSKIVPNRNLRVALIGSNPTLVTRKLDGSVGGIAADLGRLSAGTRVALDA